MPQSFRRGRMRRQFAGCTAWTKIADLHVGFHHEPIRCWMKEQDRGALEETRLSQLEPFDHPFIRFQNPYPSTRTDLFPCRAFVIGQRTLSDRRTASVEISRSRTLVQLFVDLFRKLDSFRDSVSDIAIRNDLTDLGMLFMYSFRFLWSSFFGVLWYGFGFVLSYVYRQQP